MLITLYLSALFQNIMINRKGVVSMEWEKANILRSIADELKENGCEHLVDMIGEYDYQAGQVLAMFLFDRLE